MTYIIPTIHPAALLRGSKPISEVIVGDLAKANRISIEGYNQPENLVVVLPSHPYGSESAVRQALSWMDRWISLRCSVAVDVETSGLDFFNCKLYSIALSGEDGMNTAVAFTLHDKHTLSWQAEMMLTLKMKQLLADPNVPTIYHNAPYDYAVLNRKGYDIKGPIEDTMGYHHLIQPDIPHDLGWVGHSYLDVEPWKLNHKGEKMATTDDDTELLVYNAKDALNTMKLRSPLIREILDRGMNTNLMSWQMEFARLAANMEVVGIPVNKDKRRKMGEDLLLELETQKKWMQDYLDWPKFNPMSKKHAIEALYGKKGIGLIPSNYTPVTGAPSTKYEDIIDHMEHPFVKRFISYVENRHAYSTQYKDPEPGEKGGSYSRAMQDDGRLHPKWNCCGTKGSRFSSSPNCQNQRVKDRAFFEAPDGYVIVGSDKSQLELRLAACFAGVRELIEEMAKPDGDPHTLAAMNVYGEAFLKKDKKERKRLRDAVKTTVYASLYRAGVKTVHKSIRKKKFLDPTLRAAMTLDTVSHIYHSYFGKYVEFVDYHDKNYKLAQEQYYLEIPPFGRRRFFPVQPPPYTETSNWPVQTSGSDYVTSEMVLVQDELSRRFDEANIIVHGHDALYVICRERHAEDVAKIIKRIFCNTPVDGPAGRVYLTGDVNIGKNLKDVK